MTCVEVPVEPNRKKDVPAKAGTSITAFQTPDQDFALRLSSGSYSRRTITAAESWSNPGGALQRFHRGPTHQQALEVATATLSLPIRPDSHRPKRQSHQFVVVSRIRSPYHSARPGPYSFRDVLQGVPTDLRPRPGSQ